VRSYICQLDDTPRVAAGIGNKYFARQIEELKIKLAEKKII
jgi:hypothetical protein